MLKTFFVGAFFRVSVHFTFRSIIAAIAKKQLTVYHLLLLLVSIFISFIITFIFIKKYVAYLMIRNE